MKIRVRKKHVAFGLIIVVGLGLIAAEVFVLSAGVRAGCVGLLERTGSWNRLVGMLDDDSRDVWTAASDALVRNGAAATPALTRGLDRLSEPGRGLAATTLGRIGPDARSAVPALKQHMLADDSDEVRQAAASALGLIVRDDPSEVAELLGSLQTGDAPNRIGAARAVPSLNGADRRRAVPHLIDLLKHPNPRVREEVAETFGMLGVDTRPAIPALMDALADPDPKVRDEAGEALEHYLHVAGTADPELTKRISAAIVKSRASTAPSEPPRQP